MRYDGVMICSDFDGTLACEATVSKENADAIRMFQENGGRFTLATGRTPAFVAEKFENIKVNAPLISLNGSAIYDMQADKLLYTACLDDPSAFALGIYMNERCYQANVFTEDLKDAYFRKKEAGSVEAFAKKMTEGDILKIVFIFDDTETPVLLGNMLRPLYSDNFYFARSWGYSLEVNSINGSKGAALKRIKELLPDVTLTVGAGDYENDISLIEGADIGYAVENAVDEVKQVADRITVSCREHAIAKIIYEL